MSNENLQAPPPPPLPAGMTIVPQAAPTAPQAAPTAPQGGQTPPPPPPLPAGLSMGAGRTTMSLADATKEKEKEEEQARIAAERPMVFAKGGNISGGDPCFARSAMDGLYYYGKIKTIDRANKTTVIKFFDDVETSLAFEKVYTVDEAIKEMQCFANYSGRGNYFPAQIDSKTDEAVNVHYDENPGIKETLAFSQIRFALR